MKDIQDMMRGSSAEGRLPAMLPRSDDAAQDDHPAATAERTPGDTQWSKEELAKLQEDLRRGYAAPALMPNRLPPLQSEGLRGDERIAICPECGGLVGEASKTCRLCGVKLNAPSPEIGDAER